MDSAPTETVQDRLDRVQELTEFTEKCMKQLEKLFHQLGWSPDSQEVPTEALEQCPYDRHHRVPARSMEKHKRSCSLRTMGYSSDELAEMADASVCYEKSSVRSFTMDKQTQHQVILQARAAAPLMRMEGVFWQGQYSSQPVDVPQNHKRAVCDLTVADRLALYDHVITVLNQQKDDDAAASSSQDDLYVDLVSKLQKDEEQNEPKTHLELMAEMRDYKRRRQSYRAKNVHITKKSYTEVIREVINVHSEELSRQWREEHEEEESEPSSSQRRRSVGSRSSSSESRHSHGRRHRSRDRSCDRESRKRRRRERDSRSPEDRHRHRHHDRKKKKKKKKKKEEEEE